MASIAPTINATTPEDYARRIDNVKGFATRLHIDVGDGVFTDVKTVGLTQVYDIDGVPFYKQLRDVDIKVGMAINVETTIEQVRDILPTINHLVVFTGKLGHNGGEFRADCLEKIGQARAINPDLEIAVDGGLNQETARKAVEAGANLLDVGSFIHDSADPEIAYIAVEAIAEGTS
jgi:pentose-5-phosphate-3-epimerase